MTLERHVLMDTQVHVYVYRMWPRTNTALSNVFRHCAINLRWLTSVLFYIISCELVYSTCTCMRPTSSPVHPNPIGRQPTQPLKHSPPTLVSSPDLVLEQWVAEGAREEGNSPMYLITSSQILTCMSSVMGMQPALSRNVAISCTAVGSAAKINSLIKYVPKV